MENSAIGHRAVLQPVPEPDREPGPRCQLPDLPRRHHLLHDLLQAHRLLTQKLDQLRAGVHSSESSRIDCCDRYIGAGFPLDGVLTGGLLGHTYSINSAGNLPVHPDLLRELLHPVCAE